MLAAITAAVMECPPRGLWRLFIYTLSAVQCQLLADRAMRLPNMINFCQQAYRWHSAATGRGKLIGVLGKEALDAVRTPLSGQFYKSAVTSVNPFEVVDFSKSASDICSEEIKTRHPLSNCWSETKMKYGVGGGAVSDDAAYLQLLDANSAKPLFTHYGTA